MAKASGPGLKRYEIPYFEGVNTLVGANVSKKTEFKHIENARSKVIGTIEKREGTRRLGDNISANANYGLFWFENTGHPGMMRISKVSSTVKLYYLNGSGVWTALTGSGSGLAEGDFDWTFALGKCYIVQGTSSYAPISIASDGTTVSSQSTTAGGLLGAPAVARLINYYKNKLYMGDINIGSLRYKNLIQMSSTPLGVGGLVDGDHIDGFGITFGDSTTRFDVTNPSGTTFRYTWDGTGTDPRFALYDMIGLSIAIVSTNMDATNEGNFTVTGQGTNYFQVTNASGTAENDKTIGGGSVTSSKRLAVTDTKYFTIGQNVDIYRAGVAIETALAVESKTETSLAFTTNGDGTADITREIHSGDEVWIANTYSTSARRFAWATTASGGTYKEYDTITFPGGQDNALTMMENIGEVMVIANAHDMAVWNDYTLQNFDNGIGCTSKRGHVKAANAIWFAHYSGVYSTNGGLPTLVSSKVQKYIDGATKAGFDACAAGKKGFSVFFMIGDVTLYHDDGSTDRTLTDVCLEYNIRQENWFVHTGIDAKMFITYIHSTNPDRLEFLESGGGYDVIELFNTEQDETTTEIPFRIDTDNISLAANFENYVKVHKIIIEMERGSGLECFVSIDNGEFYQIEGEANKGCSILNVTGRDDESTQPARCRQIKFSLRDYTEKMCKITRVALIYEESLETETQ